MDKLLKREWRSVGKISKPIAKFNADFIPKARFRLHLRKNAETSDRMLQEAVSRYIFPTVQFYHEKLNMVRAMRPFSDTLSINVSIANQLKGGV